MRYRVALALLLLIVGCLLLLNCAPVYHLHISTDSARALINGYCK